ncbi:MAG: UvrD-helicase domain-containing protein [Bacteroidales bacterium]|nr:UvrD-helicase domain-containing protein [Bacteroidales bacterium]MBR5780979.1 UvrD-helicase domain-containing protein [Bacteroidales bacterium]
MKNITYISAGAGSGKTTRIIDELVKAIENNTRPSEIMMTTFTRAAAQEMQERAKKKLLELGMPDKANEMGAATIGTIHSVCLRFIRKYWYLIGISPDIQEMDENDFKMYVDLSLFQHVEEKDMQEFEEWRKELGLTHYVESATKPYVNYWRDWLRVMVDKVRYYHIDDLKQSCEESKKEIDAVFARYAFDTDKYTICTEKYAELLSGIQRSAQRIEKIKKYNPTSDGIASKMKPLKGWNEELEQADKDWLFEANKVIFTNSQKETAIALVEKLFNILTKWQKQYQTYKLTHKMLDFNDMEVYFLNLLEKPEVQAEISTYKLVLVDEFQDCNPMQIDIFKRISDLVPRSIWVGDPKQAIYGFRGTDTTLVKEVSNQIVNGENGCIRDSLDISYRSREELVKYVNKEFLGIFSKVPFSLPKGEIELEVGRKYAVENPPCPLQSWTVSNVEGIAYQIRELITQEKTYIQPKDKTLSPRLAQYGDIAILVRTNTDVNTIAEALRNAGVPFYAAEDKDKDVQPIEKLLLMAFAQYKYSKKFRPHLRADILHLLKNESTEALLKDYFKKISVSFDGKNRQYNGRDEWKTDGELIQRIEQIITDCYAKSLYDTLTTFVDRLNLYDFVAIWGDAEFRRSNIHKILQLAKSFDHHCKTLGIEKPAFADYTNYMDDASAKTELNLDSPSVKILTMHKSKGLEWPIVIYYDADNKSTSDDKIVSREFFDIREQRNADDSNSYWLRVFPPLAGQQSLSRYTSYLSKESYFSSSKERIEADETRLRYVVFTRARDILIQVNVVADALVHGSNTDPKPQTYTLIDTAATQQEGGDLTYLVNPSRSGITSALKPSDSTKVDRIDISEKKEDVRMSSIGTCIHNIYAAYDASMDEQTSISMAQRIIESVKLSQILNAKEVIKAIRLLYDYLSKNHGASISIDHEVPFSFVRKNGQLLRGEIDLLWHTQDGVVLVDYKNIQGEEANPEHYASQMEAYREVIESAGLKCKGIVLFYATLGQIIELK